MINTQEAFSQIALTLINHFACVYYVDVKTSQFTNLVPLKLFEDAGIPFHGNDFFSEILEHISKCIHPNDIEIVKQLLNKENMLKNLSKNDVAYQNFRTIKGKKIIHMRHTSFMSPDKEHIICCLENIEESFQQSEEQKKNLESAERMARFDQLTGVRNKNAYQEFIEELEAKISSDANFQFAVLLCDMNDLKLMNDTRGHSFGDEAIQRTSRMICEVFTHSPIFRIGGDEFVAILDGQDYLNRSELLKELKKESFANKQSRSGPVVACGMADYNPETDSDYNCVFKRADQMMYQNKKEIKTMYIKQDFRDMGKLDKKITIERKRQLDALFGALHTVSGGGYIYLNDMHYDFSRWSLQLVDDFSMKSEYMYHADKIWQERIHPEDTEAYKEAIDAVLCNIDAQIKPLTYRARKKDGTYAVLSTRGFILSDKKGNPDYFGGIIIPQ